MYDIHVMLSNEEPKHKRVPRYSVDKDYFFGKDYDGRVIFIVPIDCTYWIDIEPCIMGVGEDISAAIDSFKGE